MTIHLVMSSSDGRTYHPEVWRRSEAAADQWVRDHRLSTGGLQYRVMCVECAEVPIPRSERAARAER